MDVMNSDKVTEINYFIDHGIRIKDIKSVYHHNLALDYNGNVYSFGNNDEGQCGDGTFGDVKEPKLIDTFKGLCIDKKVRPEWHLEFQLEFQPGIPEYR